MILHQQTQHVADDCKEDVFLLVRAFVKAGLAHSIQSVPDGEDAIAYLSGQPPYMDRNQYPLPQLMLLDLKMPKKDGFAVLEWLRSQPQLGELPVVVLSSSSLQFDIATAHRLGARDFKTKPIDPGALVNIVKDVCARWLDERIPGQPEQIEVAA